MEATPLAYTRRRDGKEWDAEESRELPGGLGRGCIWEGPRGGEEMGGTVF